MVIHPWDPVITQRCSPGCHFSSTVHMLWGCSERMWFLVHNLKPLTNGRAVFHSCHRLAVCRTDRSRDSIFITKSDPDLLSWGNAHCVRRIWVIFLFLLNVQIPRSVPFLHPTWWFWPRVQREGWSRPWVWLTESCLSTCVISYLLIFDVPSSGEGRSGFKYLFCCLAAERI